MWVVDPQGGGGWASRESVRVCMQLHPVPLVGSPGRHRLSWDNPTFTTMRLLTDDGLEWPGKSDTIPVSGLGPAHGREMFGGAYMAGTWERTGDGQFVLDPAIAVEVYRWHEPGQSGSGFVEFQSPKEYPHRRFYPSEVLEALKRGEPANDYVERMCRLGISLLPEMDSVFREWVIAATGSNEWYAGKETPAPEALAVLLALFEGRREGHQRVARDFHREDDFYATEGSRKKDDFLVPGVEPPRRPSKARLTGKDVIRHVAKSLPDCPAPEIGRAS